MLPQENRVRKNKEFEQVFKKTKPVFTKNLTFRSVLRRNGETRFGFVISNKISKLATRRNSLKRQLRTISQSLISEIESGYDVVVVVKEDFSYPYKQEEIRKQVEEGFRKSGIIKDTNNK